MDINKIFNLINLYGGAKNYASCKSDKVSQVMDEFKEGKLKGRDNKIIKNQKQAIAIALTQASNKCEYNKEDENKLIEKVDKDLNNKDKKILLSNLIETKDAIEILLKNGKSRRVYIFKKLLWDKIIDTQRNNQQLEMNMWDEIKKIHELN